MLERTKITSLLLIIKYHSFSDQGLVDCDILLSSTCILIFWRNMLPPASGLKCVGWGITLYRQPARQGVTYSHWMECSRKPAVCRALKGSAVIGLPAILIGISSLPTVGHNDYLLVWSRRLLALYISSMKTEAAFSCKTTVVSKTTVWAVTAMKTSKLVYSYMPRFCRSEQHILKFILTSKWKI